jgi:tyrosine-protein kinase Etk/Wzc
MIPIASPPMQPTPQLASEDEDEGLALGEIIAVLMDYRWLIAAICLCTLALGLGWVFVSKPIYRADGLLQIEEKKGSGGVFKALEPLLGEDTTVSAEVEILSSRMVLGRVVAKLKLDIVATPQTLPLIGGAVARRYEGDEPNSPWLGLSSFAWGEK